MKKIFIVLFILSFICFLNCASKKSINLRQVSSDRFVVIRADTVRNKAIVFSIPLEFEFTNSSSEGRGLETAIYYYHPRYYSDSSRIASMEGWVASGINRAVIYGKLERLTRLNRSDRMVRNSGESRSVFSTIHGIDTTYASQSIFESYIAEMKERKTDTMSIMPANKFIKQYPDFCKKTLIGDSILFDIYNENNKNDTTLYLPIRLITD